MFCVVLIFLASIHLAFNANDVFEISSLKLHSPHSRLDGNVFQPSRATISISRNFADHQPLPFESPILRANSGRIRLSFLQTEFSNAFSISPSTLVAGQQFDIIIDDTNILRNFSKIKLHVRFSFIYLFIKNISNKISRILFKNTEILNDENNHFIYFR
ncbi:unnamed protein product [Dracunculus medinensis]|uniref:Uncharacterized protein n=1 Tax=Dracunculus medinensis TaxID=318479 RepID=A0A0N4U2H4_DRAME|nr:unnamed protein product [Dracunculus medinensis]